jgi:two-component system alkaline phosphatase synthesis response regulator PhoP
MKQKILIIEDDKILAEMYEDKFKEAGFDVDVVFSVEEALIYLTTKKPNLILLDILLPRKNGIYLLKEIRQNKNFSDINVVAFSNYDDPQTKKEAFESGIKKYLIKTKYTPKELIEEIRKFL